MGSPTYTNGITNLYYRGPGGLMTCFTPDLVIFFFPLIMHMSLQRKNKTKTRGRTLGTLGLDGSPFGTNN